METTGAPGTQGVPAVDATRGMALIAPAMIPPATGGPDEHREAPGGQLAPAPARGKLGLALAGGGFRASLFHLGVFRRLAELDVLRRIEVLSTVSGGSITGALYVLLLKKYLERSPEGSLTRDQYIELVKELEAILVDGVRKNLRTRLLMNPIGMLSVLLSGDSMGRRMARLYERHLFAKVGLQSVSPPPWWRPAWLWPGQVRMRDLVIAPGGRPLDEDLSQYNAKQRAEGKSVLTTIAINATTLNSGGRFHFSAVEVGDWYLGYFRASEFDDLLARKDLLALTDDELVAIANGAAPPAVTIARSDGDAPYRWPAGEASRAAALALHRRGSDKVSKLVRDPFGQLFARPGFPGLVDDAPFGLLRKAKLAAWFLRCGEKRTPPVLGGRTRAEHLATFWSGLVEVDPDVGKSLQAAASSASLHDQVLDYVLELYLLRAAECVSARIHRNWQNIRVGHAVGASACFPPVFPPFLFLGLYDDLHVTRLGLTDGGVYDNIGITALLDEGCTELIASDTSGLFHVAPASPCGRFGLALRIPNLLMRALGGSQLLGLQERGRVSRKLAGLAPEENAAPTPASEEIAALRAAVNLDPLVYFHIGSPPVEPHPIDSPDRFGPPLRLETEARDVAGLRTDLDGFGDTEIAALVNHGYDLADRHVRRDGARLVRGETEGVPSPPRRPSSRERARLVLDVGRARFFRALKLRCAVPLVCTIAVAAALIGVVWKANLTLDRIVGAAGSIVTKEIAFLDWLWGLLPGTSQRASSSRAWLAGLLLLLSLVFLVVMLRRAGPRSKARHPRRSLRRLAATVLKYGRALRGNLLWGVFGMPLLIAIGSAAVSLLSYVFYHLPFMRATRIPPR